jgi:HNH endonuclease
MQYWWVNHNEDNHDWMLEKRRLWASKFDRAGRMPAARSALSNVRRGDKLFSHFRKHIDAILTAEADPVAGVHNDEEGWRLAVSTEPLNPLRVDDIRSELEPLLARANHSPLNRLGKVNQGYVYDVPPEAAKLIEGAVKTGLVQGRTKREALIAARIGQGQFWSQVGDYWNWRCPATGKGARQLLHASHIKPWDASSDRERLDPCNGLFLEATFHAAFDAGLIGFGGNGELLLSHNLPSHDRKQLKQVWLGPIRHLTATHRDYLRYHRESVFRQTSSE